MCVCFHELPATGEQPSRWSCMGPSGFPGYSHTTWGLSASPLAGRVFACGDFCTLPWPLQHVGCSSATCGPPLASCSIAASSFLSLTLPIRFFPDVLAFSFCKLNFGLLAARISHRPRALWVIYHIRFAVAGFSGVTACLSTHAQEHRRVPWAQCLQRLLASCPAVPLPEHGRR